jgi:L-histidine N-alpha-methyltransferase
MLAEIRDGLARSPKQLPSKLFYDTTGSQLFEEITGLPEYYLTRTEELLLNEHVPRWTAGLRPASLVELGAGSAAKTRIILNAMCAHSTPVTYVPIDISATYLQRTADALRAEYAALQVEPIVADFTGVVELPPSLHRPALFTFLGSTIGNFALSEAVLLLCQMGLLMGPGDRFILGVDLRKDARVLEAAYNDSRGVTAEFNRNMLRVINREFGADFDVDSFRHHAFYNAAEHRIEMHLISSRDQEVSIPGAGVFTFGDAEKVRTEISCKYDRPAVAGMFVAAGLELVEWCEDADGLFALAQGALIHDS